MLEKTQQQLNKHHCLLSIRKFDYCVHSSYIQSFMGVAAHTCLIPNKYTHNGNTANTHFSSTIETNCRGRESFIIMHILIFFYDKFQSLLFQLSCACLRQYISNFLCTANSLVQYMQVHYLV